MVDELTVEARDAKLDAAIAHVDARLSAQVREILHHPDFQRLEAAWRGLEFLVNHVDFGENIRVELLNISKEELARDVRALGGVEGSALHHIVYDRGFRAVGGEPYGLLVGEYWFDASDEDIATLDGVARVAAKAHAPFLASAAPAMLGLDSWDGLRAIADRLGDLRAHFDGPQYRAWHTFREREHARYLALCLPRILLRLPYGARNTPARPFEFEEGPPATRAELLWGNAAIALATCAARSFARYRWCANLIGYEAGCDLEHLPFDDDLTLPGGVPVWSTECTQSERREYELSEEGFIGIYFSQVDGTSVFLSANSVCWPRVPLTGTAGFERVMGDLTVGLPHLFMATRFAHYVKRICEEALRAGDSLEGAEEKVERWMAAHRTEGEPEGATSKIVDGKLLRAGHVALRCAGEGEAGLYRFELRMSPVFGYLRQPIELRLRGVIDVGDEARHA